MALPTPSAPPRTPAPSASAPEPEPSDDFRAAMAELDAGDNTGAAAAFVTFLVKHPRDPRAEDAAYLRVIASSEAGTTRA
jgi:TolA-binding protein